jgi:hypothetical protein
MRKDNITTNLTEMITAKEYNELLLYDNKLNNWDEMDK